MKILWIDIHAISNVIELGIELSKEAGKATIWLGDVNMNKI